MEALGREWEKWDVLTSVESMGPPRWLVSENAHPVEGVQVSLQPDHETFGDVAKKRTAVIQQQWNQFVTLLNAEGKGTGYDRLVTLRRNLNKRQEKIAPSLDKWIDRRDYLKKIEEAYVNELYAHCEQNPPPQVNSPIVETSSDVDDARKEILKVELTFSDTPDDPTQDLPPLADSPIVETFLNFGDSGKLIDRPNLEGCWTIEVEPASSDEPAQRENTKVLYRPSEEKLEELNIDPGNVNFLWSQISTDPSATWREALQDIHELKEMVIHEGARYQRTADLIDFRLRLLENILYRFETFGSTREMTEEQAKEIAEKQAGSEPPISGYHGAEYAVEAKEILDNQTITSFSRLEREMKSQSVSGSSRVSTVKRNIGYEDLPSEEKGFSRFRELLTNKVEQLRGED